MAIVCSNKNNFFFFKLKILISLEALIRFHSATGLPPAKSKVHQIGKETTVSAISTFPCTPTPFAFSVHSFP